MHSPFGVLYPVIEKTGWTIHRIIWKESWIKIQLIMSDAPGVKMGKTKSEGKTTSGKKGLLSR